MKAPVVHFNIWYQIGSRANRSLVIVDNANGKFTITGSEANDEATH